MLEYITDLFTKQNPVTILLLIIGLIVSFNWIYTQIKEFINNSGIKFTKIEEGKKDHEWIENANKRLGDIDKKLEIMEEKDKANINRNMETTKTIIEIGNSLDSLAKENQILKEGIRQITSDRCEQKIRHYNSIGYIPDEEYENFCEFLEYAIKTLNCNHGLERKYNDCKSKLPVLTLEEAAHKIAMSNNFNK